MTRGMAKGMTGSVSRTLASLRRAARRASEGAAGALASAARGAAGGDGMAMGGSSFLHAAKLSGRSYVVGPNPPRRSRGVGLRPSVSCQLAGSPIFFFNFTRAP